MCDGEVRALRLSAKGLDLRFSKGAACLAPTLRKMLTRSMQAHGLPPSVGCGFASLALPPPFVSLFRSSTSGMLRLRVPLIIVGGTFAFARGGLYGGLDVGGDYPKGI